MTGKIGLGIITCNRADFFKRCMASIPLHRIDECVIVNDGEPYESTVYPRDTHIKKGTGTYTIRVLQNKENQGVGKTKNKAFKYLMERECEHIFLIEDDILVKNENVFDEYVKYASKTGLGHLLFGYHGPANKGGISGGAPKPRKVIDYGDDVKVALNEHCVGAMCYYSKTALDEVGLIDEDFLNAFEHVEHSYRLALKGHCPAYWWWPDIHNSLDFLDEIQCSEHSSTIRPREDWMKNIQAGALLFEKKHGVKPAWDNAVPNLTLEEVQQHLKMIYGKAQ